MNKQIGIILLVIIFISGNITGFFIGVFASKTARQFFIGMFEQEKEADIKKQKEIIRPNFRVKYPTNWTIDTADEDYDPDRLFSIESPGNSLTMFIIFDAETSPKENIENQINAHVPKLLKNPERIPFTNWGQYIGEGIELKGKILGLYQGGVRIFSYSTKIKSFIIVEFSYEEDLKQVKPGLELIELTFILNE